MAHGLNERERWRRLPRTFSSRDRQQTRDIRYIFAPDERLGEPSERALGQASSAACVQMPSVRASCEVATGAVRRRQHAHQRCGLGHERKLRLDISKVMGKSSGLQRISVTRLRAPRAHSDERHCRRVGSQLPGVPVAVRSVVGGQQCAAFEDQLVRVGRAGQPRKESFQCVELVQLVGGPAAPAGQVLQVEVGAAGAGRPGRSPWPGHSRTCSAARRAGSAFGKDRAMASRALGWVCGWRSQRRNASTAMSLPS